MIATFFLTTKKAICQFDRWMYWQVLLARNQNFKKCGMPYLLIAYTDTQLEFFFFLLKIHNVCVCKLSHKFVKLQEV